MNQLILQLIWEQSTQYLVYVSQWFPKSAPLVHGGPRGKLKWSKNPFTNQYFGKNRYKHYKCINGQGFGDVIYKRPIVTLLLFSEWKQI